VVTTEEIAGVIVETTEVTTGVKAEVLLVMTNGRAWAEKEKEIGTARLEMTGVAPWEALEAVALPGTLTVIRCLSATSLWTPMRTRCATFSPSLATLSTFASSTPRT
jgi:hypothetical protein